MNKFKYNLFGILIPEGYRWVRRGENYSCGDTWWRSDTGLISAYTIITNNILCDENFPRKFRKFSGEQHTEYAGYIRKI